MMAKGQRITIRGRLALQKVTRDRLFFLLEADEFVDFKNIAIDPTVLPENYDFALHDLTGKVTIEIDVKER